MPDAQAYRAYKRRRSRRIRHCVGCDAAASYPTYKYHRARRLDKAVTPHPAFVSDAMLSHLIRPTDITALVGGYGAMILFTLQKTFKLS